MEDELEILIFFKRHIENPCTDPNTGEDIRFFYIQEAKRIIDKMENVYYKESLHSIIRKYS